jgi:RNA polymerase sigma-70 factor, ECF subfamily
VARPPLRIHVSEVSIKIGTDSDVYLRAIELAMATSNQTTPSNGPDPSSISSTLLDRMRSGRPEAWERLVDLYGPVVYRWCRQLGVGRTDAADVVQEVFTAVSAHLARFRRDRPEDSFGGWLRTITRNKVYDHFRQGSGRAVAEGGTTAYRHMLDVPESMSESQAASVASQRLDPDQQFARRALMAVRAEFEDRTWEAFWRIAVDGQSPVDAALAMGQSLHAVYKAKSRVLRRLRQEWRDSLD